MTFFSMIEDEPQKSKFLEIHENYRYMMLYVAKGILKDNGLAEDAVQEAFMTLAKHIKRLDQSDSSNTKSFVYLVIKHAAIDIYRKRKREHSKYILMESYFELNMSDLDLESQIIEKTEIRGIMQVISMLSPTYKDILELYFIHEIPQKEIASILYISYETVKKRVQRGRNILEKELRDMGYE